jgi:hypothetical protein
MIEQSVGTWQGLIEYQTKTTWKPGPGGSGELEGQAVGDRIHSVASFISLRPGGEKKQIWLEH